MKDLYRGQMRGRTMYGAVLYVGPLGTETPNLWRSPTPSTSNVSMRTMTWIRPRWRNGRRRFFVKALHSVGAAGTGPATGLPCSETKSHGDWEITAATLLGKKCYHCVSRRRWPNMRAGCRAHADPR